GTTRGIPRGYDLAEQDDLAEHRGEDALRESRAIRFREGAPFGPPDHRYFALQPRGPQNRDAPARGRSHAGEGPETRRPGGFSHRYQPQGATPGIHPDRQGPIRWRRRPIPKLR